MQNYCQINRHFLTVIGFSLAMLLGACDPPVQKQMESHPDPVAEQFVKANQYMQRRHQDHIAAFLDRVGWEANLTPTGLWVVIENQGAGEAVRENCQVTFSFESTLLDGTPCYEATVPNPKIITIGKGGVESGVEQGMMWLREGAQAIFLIHPHLAHGNFGDRDKIPGNSVLIYHLKVMEVQ